MYIAQSKRKENIAEYILYLWQIEDLLRALQLSPEAILSQLVEPLALSAEQKQQLFAWYMDIVGLLNREGKDESGHIDHTLQIIADLQTLHNQLLTSPAGLEYRKHYELLAPQIDNLKAKLSEPSIGDVELFFRALYSVILIRIRGEEGAQSSHVADVIDLISPVVAELASLFHSVEEGETELFMENT